METQRVCKDCGAVIAADTPEGLCPKCLIRVGLGSQPGNWDKTVGGVGPDSLPDPALLARCFPQLELIELLGQGGMGIVYKARQPALDRFVALKVLPVRAAGDPGFTERFTREARALARLSHPHIVAVFDFGEVKLPAGLETADAPLLAGSHYFIMEYVDGLNLRQLEQAGKLSPRQALEIIPQICEALQYAHDEGVVHRDIKPENVLLDKKGRVKIADFGLAKITGADPVDLRLTGVRDVMGTPHYMAPEQVEHPQQVDHRADIYSLGVVFYEMLTGELPLGRFSPPSSRAHGLQIDLRLDEVVLHALEKEPARRYQHASQVKTDVESIAAGSRAESSPGTPDAEARPERQHSASAHQRRPEFWKIAVGALAATMTLVLLVSIGRIALGLRPLQLKPTELNAASPSGSADKASAVPAADLVIPPVVINTVPPSGAAEVDPGLGELRVTFSAPMLTNSWSLVKPNPENFPEAAGPIHFAADGRTCVVPVKLKPGTVYAIWLNNEEAHNFRDRRGVAACSYLLIFETKK